MRSSLISFSPRTHKLSSWGRRKKIDSKKRKNKFQIVIVVDFVFYDNILNHNSMSCSELFIFFLLCCDLSVLSSVREGGTNVISLVVALCACKMLKFSSPHATRLTENNHFKPCNNQQLLYSPLYFLVEEMHSESCKNILLFSVHTKLKNLLYIEVETKATNMEETWSV